MNEIRLILKTAARRLELTSFLGWAHLLTVLLGIAVLCLLFAERIGEQTFLPWNWMLPSFIAVGLLVAGRIWYVRRNSELQVALEVDERLDLHEKLSTALHCSGRDDAFARTALDDAVQTARDAKTREAVNRHFSVKAPRRWWLSPMIIALAVGLWFVPALDLFAAEEPEVLPEGVALEQAPELAVDAVIKKIKESPELRKELDDMLGNLSNDPIDPKAPKSRERKAIKNLTELNKRLDDLLNGSKGKTAEALKKSLKQLKTPESGPAKDLADALAKGDFVQAQKALEKLMADLDKGKLDKKQQEQLAKQLEDIAKQMEKLAQQQQQMEQLLKQAGMNPQLAQNPQALQQAIQNNKNLNQQQKQQLQQMAQAQQAAAKACQGLGQACQQMAQGMKQGQRGQAGQDMANQLNQLEAMQQMLMQAQAAANACKNGQCKGLGMQQAWQQWQTKGGAFGNRGQSSGGGKAQIKKTPAGTKVEQAKTKMTQGDIIARWLVEGPNYQGESTKTLEQVEAVVAEGYEEGLSEDEIPIRYREAQKHYFGELQDTIKAIKKARKESADADNSGETPANSESDD